MVVEEDKNFVSAYLVTPEGKKVPVFFYKPQQIVVSQYATLEYVRHKGYKVVTEDGEVRICDATKIV